MSDPLTTIQGRLMGASGDYWGQLRGESLALGKNLTRTTEATDLPWSPHSLVNLLKRRRPAMNRVIVFNEVIPVGEGADYLNPPGDYQLEPSTAVGGTLFPGISSGLLPLGIGSGGILVTSKTGGTQQRRKSLLYQTPQHSRCRRARVR